MSMMLRKNKIFNIENPVKKKEGEIIEHINPSNNNEDNSLVVGENVTITGNIDAKNEVKILGKVEADVNAKKIIVGKSGNLQGKIKTNVFEISGKVGGEIEVENFVKVLSTGILEGKISYQNLRVMEGGCIKGELIAKEQSQDKSNNLIKT